MLLIHPTKEILPLVFPSDKEEIQTSIVDEARLVVVVVVVEVVVLVTSG
jgi:hypothetical protein